jgi:hypothetical protein
MVIRILYLKYTAGVETVYLGQTDFASFIKEDTTAGRLKISVT